MLVYERCPGFSCSTHGPKSVPFQLAIAPVDAHTRVHTACLRAHKGLVHAAFGGSHGSRVGQVYAHRTARQGFTPPQTQPHTIAAWGPPTFIGVVVLADVVAFRRTDIQDHAAAGLHVFGQTSQGHPLLLLLPFFLCKATAILA